MKTRTHYRIEWRSRGMACWALWSQPTTLRNARKAAVECRDWDGDAHGVLVRIIEVRERLVPVGRERK